jgi:RNA polymerase sigma factor (sigma-70 family)
MVELTRDHEIWQKVDEITSIIAYNLSKKYHRFAEREDIKQAMNEYAWKRKDKVNEYLMREDDIERRMGYKAFTTFMRRAGERYARKEKARALGYELGDEYFYRVEMVENLIKVLGSEDTHLVNQVLDPDVHGIRAKKQPNEGNNLIALLSDVAKAMKKLDPRTQGILNSRFAQDLPLTEIASAWDISPQRVEQIVNRGVRDLIELLGGATPYR